MMQSPLEELFSPCYDDEYLVYEGWYARVRNRQIHKYESHCGGRYHMINGVVK